jgi:hypothetical protein
MSKFKSSVLLFLMGAMPIYAAAELIPGTTNLSIELQAAQVVAAGKDLKMYRIPIKDLNTGATTFFDATFEFGRMDDGSIGFKRISTASVSHSSLRQGDNFITGTYADTAGNRFGVTSTYGAGGRIQYHITSLNSGKAFSASWFTGPVAGHPQAIKSTCVDGPVGAYGLGGGASSGETFPVVGTLTGTNILGFTQVSGNQLAMSRISGISTDCLHNPGLILTLLN